MKTSFKIALLIFVSIKLNSQSIDTGGLVYANINENITALSFDEKGRYVGIINDRYLSLFNKSNLIIDKLDLVKINEGTVDDWFRIRKISFHKDLITILNINSIQVFEVVNSKIELVSSTNRVGKVYDLFEDKRIKLFEKKLNKDNNYLGSKSNWHFGYVDNQKANKKIQPELWFYKQDTLVTYPLPKVDFDFKRANHLWYKEWAITWAAFDNHFEISESNIYFSFPYQDKLVVFNSNQGRVIDLTIPKVDNMKSWYTYVDKSTNIPYIIINDDNQFLIYYLNKEFKATLLGSQKERPLGIIKNEIYTKRTLSENEKKYTGHYLIPYKK